MKDVKILRLKNGDDIICLCEVFKDCVKVENPYLIAIEVNVKTLKQVLVLQHWLPINLIEENSTIVLESDIMLRLNPKKDIEEYFLNMIDNKSELSKEDIKSLLDTLDLQYSKIH